MTVLRNVMVTHYGTEAAKVRFMQQLVEVVKVRFLQCLTSTEMDVDVAVTLILCLPVVLRNLLKTDECLKGYERNYFTQLLEVVHNHAQEVDSTYILERVLRQG
jgi:hypothetical protein